MVVALEEQNYILHDRHVLGNPVVRRDLISLQESSLLENGQVTFELIASSVCCHALALNNRPQIEDRSV